MKETLFELLQLVFLGVGVGFVVLCFVGFPPADDEPTYYWEIDD